MYDRGLKEVIEKVRPASLKKAIVKEYAAQEALGIQNLAWLACFQECLRNALGGISRSVDLSQALAECVPRELKKGLLQELQAQKHLMLLGHGKVTNLFRPLASFLGAAVERIPNGSGRQE